MKTNFLSGIFAFGSADKIDDMLMKKYLLSLQGTCLCPMHKGSTWLMIRLIKQLNAGPSYQCDHTP